MNEMDMEFYRRERKKYADAIIGSLSRKKLIIAGPGTGKTFIFRSLFGNIKRTSGKEGLALTFIRNLATGLRLDLAGLAKVSTFHAFCKSMAHTFKNQDFEYYPKMLKVIEEDFDILGLDKGRDENIERCFFGLKNDAVIEATLKIGDYYNAAGHSDSVYRVIRYFENQPDKTPDYPLIAFDEYQDFNYLEIRLVEVLSKANPILIVGDDDQALYAFKQASPDYIRRLSNNPEFETFELPYCSRCTKTIVNAVENIVLIAEQDGRLDGRIKKPFKYFPPDKEKDSRRYPNIINVNCTVERKNCHYMGRFIAREISLMPRSYLLESKRLREPAALIIGPRQFLDGVRKELSKKFDHFEDKRIADEEIAILDGYKSLAMKPISRLGWRIILNCDPCNDYKRIISQAISKGRAIYDLISSRKYIATHQKISKIINKILFGETISAVEKKNVERACSLSLDEITLRLLDKNNREIEEGLAAETDKIMPAILCTSFEGSKGLAAQYVFIVGMNASHFPQKYPPSNRDIYRLIVALTRTRKKCYVVSCNNFGGEVLNRSLFKTWLNDELSKEVYVDKCFITKYCN